MMQVSDMALEVVWMLTALVILATLCIGVFKGILGDGVRLRRGPRDFLLHCLARFFSIRHSGAVVWDNQGFVFPMVALPSQ